MVRRGAALALLLALSGCGADAVPMPGTPEHAPRRVMSMNPCIDAILVRVADPAQIISISHYSKDPAASSIAPDVARRFPANDDTAEEAIALRPDLVLLGSHVAPATQTVIRAVGVHIVKVGVPATVAESRAQVLEVARAVGHPDRGVALVREIDAALAAARAPAGASPVPALIRTGGGLVPGRGTLADELLTGTGFRNMSADYGLAMWDILPLEPLIARPPQLLLADLSARRDQPALLRRVPGMRIVNFPARLLSCAGPNLIDAARALAAIRQKWKAL